MEKTIRGRYDSADLYDYPVSNTCYSAILPLEIHCC